MKHSNFSKDTLHSILIAEWLSDVNKLNNPNNTKSNPNQ